LKQLVITFIIAKLLKNLKYPNNYTQIYTIQDYPGIEVINFYVIFL